METTGRIICSHFNYNAAGQITTTTLYFDNGGKTLTVEGYWSMPHLITVKIKHKKNGTDPDTINKVDVMAG